MPKYIWALKFKVLLVTLSFNMLTQVWANQQLTVFDVRKTFPLTDGQKVYKDFYVNGGSELGLRPGMVITVKRRVTLYDVFQNKSPGDLFVSVGKLKLIHVQKGVSVAREYAQFSRASNPILDYDFIMVGDKLDLNTISMDRGRKKSASEKTARVKVKQIVKPKSHSSPVMPEILPEKKQAASVKEKPISAPVNSVSM